MTELTQILIGQNITILYKYLALQDLDINKIKSFVSNKAAIINMPDTLVVMDPEGPLVIQFGDKRIRITYQGESAKLAPLWDIAAKCHELVGDAELVAYGFNYDIMINAASQNFETMMLEMFSCNAENLTKKLEGDLATISPRIRYFRKPVNYELILEPIDPTKLKSHLNAHYQYTGIQATANELEKGFTKEFNYISNLMPRLLDHDWA